ncbi:MAG: hypothetical protein R2747_09940 [Pyrinomonadaceae bacterium]
MKKFIYLALTVLLCVAAARASEPAIWTVDTSEDVLKGDAVGVSIGSNGAITLSPKLDELYDTGQPFVWSSAVDSNGNFYLGTGSDGRIYRIDPSGAGRLLADLEEINVSALAIGKGGELFAGTSPDGKVYRISADGTASVFFDPKEKYIWSLTVLSDGSLAVGTGENGKIYKVKGANQTPEKSLFFDTSETHIISLAADKNDNLYAGTDSNGIVLKFSPDGKPFALLDSPLREIHEIVVGPDGSVYVLALGESASTKTPETAEKTAETKTVSVDTSKTKGATPSPTPKSRYDLTGAKSAVYRIFPDGGNDVIWNSADVSAFALYAHLTGNGVLVGTSDKGRIYSVRNDGRETLALQTDEGQVSTIKTFGNRLYATSSNQGKLYRFGGAEMPEGNYQSPVLDAKSVASWGRIWWRSSGNVRLQTRSGNTEKPDETWSAWSSDYADQKGAQIASPKAKYLQWRAVLKSSGGNASAELNEVNVSYLPRNIAPEILGVEVFPTNVGLLPNPPVQLDPNIDVSGLDSSDFGIIAAPVPPRKVFLRGARSLQWTAEDRNDDTLEYAIYFRELSETNFKLLKDKLTDNFHAIDGSALADGRYVFKIVANDSLSNPAAEALTGEIISEPVDIDNTSPVVTAVGSPQINGDRARVVFEATETSSYINRAEYSLNGGDWQTVYSDDGISDSPKERYTLEIPIKEPGDYAITLRVFDANGNIGNAKVTVKK